MKTTTLAGDKPGFLKTDVPCLYRYSSNGVYYALIKHEGRQKRRSLETTDKGTAKRKLADMQRDLGKVDASQGKLTLRELTVRYLASIASQAPNTVYGKKSIIERLLADFPLGADVQIAKIKPSDVAGWVNSYRFGYSSHNRYVLVLKTLFDIAVNDKVLVESPAKDLKGKKNVKPIRITPTYEEFQKIIANIREQPKQEEANNSADFLEFMGLAGVGQAEATGLLKQHVNLSTMQITLFRVKTRTPFIIPIYPQVEALVRKLYAKADKPTDPLFPKDKTKGNWQNKKAGIPANKDATRALQTACKRLKLPVYSQRALRRMFITRCIEKGIDVKVIAQWQGHQDGGKLILGTYSHVRNTHAEEMAKLLTV